MNERQRLICWTLSSGTIAILILLIITLENPIKLSHSDNSEPRVELLQADETLIKSYNQNNKPIFTNCNKYNSVIENNVSPGYKVIQVHADDPDPKDQGGKIIYSLKKHTDEKIYFEINNVTGWINTMTVIEPTFKKEILLTVVATDNGNYPLSSECSFKIIIKNNTQKF